MHSAPATAAAYMFVVFPLAHICGVPDPERVGGGGLGVRTVYLDAADIRTYCDRISTPLF